MYINMKQNFCIGITYLKSYVGKIVSLVNF